MAGNERGFSGHFTMSTCRICLRETQGGRDYDSACLRKLFDSSSLPQLDVDLVNFSGLAQGMAGRMSISGVQEKAVVSLSPDRSRIEFTPSGGRYILKPPVNTFPEIPANEHLTMCLAALVGIEIPPCGLLQLTDGNLAYIVRRFDRLPDGGKLQQEDFCQLAQLPPTRKYDQSAELCVRLLRQYASEPPISILALYRLLLFAWCVGNGDLHLKNLSLLTTPDGVRRLSPAYDLVNTQVVISNDRLALSIGGKTSHLRRSDWLKFGEYCRIPPRAVERELNNPFNAARIMDEQVQRSFLSDERKKRYRQILQQNIAAIRA